jgi:hypothetical protein
MAHTLVLNATYEPLGVVNFHGFSLVPFPFPDALQEFSVETSAVSSRFGTHPGATVNAGNIDCAEVVG